LFYLDPLWSRERFLLPITYFPTNLAYPFTLRVTGITRKNDSTIRYRYSRLPRLSDTRYSAIGPKGNGDMQAAQYMVMRRYTESKRYGR